MKMELIEGSETLAIRTQMPGNYPKENILHIEHGKSLKSRYKNAKCVTFVNYGICKELKEKQFFILYSVVSRMSKFVALCLYLQKRIYICSKLVLKPVICEQLYRIHLYDVCTP